MIAPATYGVLVIASGILSTLCLPETHNKPLPVTVDDTTKTMKR